MTRIPAMLKVSTLIVGVIAGGAVGCDTNAVVDGEEEPELFTAYDRCAFEGPCYDDTQCRDIALDYGYAVVEDTMCTNRCESDGDCQYGGRCVHPEDEPSVCYQRCMADYDCYFGFACLDVYGDYDPVCAPL